MNKLLIDDYPIQVLPKLAELIGLNEAIILQQMHYWIGNSKHEYDNKKWIYNSYSKWIEQFPFWSESTIKRAITSLEKQNLLHVGNYNKAGFDRTKWYSINYFELEILVTRASGQNDPTMRSKWHDGRGQNDPMEEVKMTRPIPETTQRLLQRLLQIIAQLTLRMSNLRNGGNFTTRRKIRRCLSLNLNHA